MIRLEQVKLLESKVTKAIDYVKKVTEENNSLKGKLDSYQKRIEELEVLVQQFKEEQCRIEDGILSALDRLNQFEDALEKTFAAEASARPSPPPAAEAADAVLLEINTPAKKGKEDSAPILEPESAPKSEDSKANEELDIF